MIFLFLQEIPIIPLMEFGPNSWPVAVWKVRKAKNS